VWGSSQRGLFEKDHADAEAFELLADQDLMGVLASETIRTENQGGFQRAGRAGRKPKLDRLQLQVDRALRKEHAPTDSGPTYGPCHG